MQWSNGRWIRFYPLMKTWHRKTEIWQGSVEGAALKLPLGCMLHPRPRQLRMMRSFDNRQLPAVAWITPSTASGQPASLARCAARRTAKNRWTDQKMNAFIFWLALGFFMPGSSLCGFQVAGANCWFLYFVVSPDAGQGYSVPWRRIIRAAEALIGSHANFCLSMPCIHQGKVQTAISPPRRTLWLFSRSWQECSCCGAPDML